jgi:hypothetical protein
MLLVKSDTTCDPQPNLDHWSNDKILPTMNLSEHSPTFSTGQLHPMDVIVRAVETEGIVELLNRLKKRDIRVRFYWYNSTNTAAAFERVHQVRH